MATVNSTNRPADDFAAAVRDGLSRQPKTLASRWLYDERGSQLFEQITELDEYYPARTELALLRHHAPAVAEALGARAAVVEFGSGASRKTRLLLAALHEPAVYVPVDISREFLLATAVGLRAAFPALAIRPVVADFTATVPLPDDLPPHTRRAGFFPGSTIGNLSPTEAVAFLSRTRRMLGEDALMVVGIDLDKSTEILTPAYDDAAGITAEFNRNLLWRIRRELGGDLDPEAFRHEVRYRRDPPRIEMHLTSTRAHTATIAGQRFHFAAGESIHTENSHKYTLAGFAELAAAAGWQTRQQWRDADALFAVVVLATSTAG